MRFATSIVLASVAGFATAVTTTASAPASTASCDAQNIVDACLASTMAQANNCSDNDWICLCQQYTNVLTCYNNCPGDVDRFGTQQTQISYCNAAAPLLSASSVSASLAASTRHSSLATSATATTTGAAASATGSSANSAAAATSTGAAAQGVAVSAGGLFAVVLGIAGLL